MRPVSGMGVGGAGMQAQAQVQRPVGVQDRYRLRQAEQAESTVAQVRICVSVFCCEKRARL